MQGSDFETIFEALNRAGVRYLVVGGVAVVLHGHARFTADLDLVVQLEESNAHRAIAALAGLGYRARAPVPAEQFADAALRRSWIEDKELTVFTLWSPEHPVTEVDLFVAEPFDFAAAEAGALRVDLGGLVVPVAALDVLLAMKRATARPKDLEDVRALEALEDGRGSG
jgi:hypothetical protein